MRLRLRCYPALWHCYPQSEEQPHGDVKPTTVSQSTESFAKYSTQRSSPRASNGDDSGKRCYRSRQKIDSIPSEMEAWGRDRSQKLLEWGVLCGSSRWNTAGPMCRAVCIPKKVRGWISMNLVIRLEALYFQTRQLSIYAWMLHLKLWC